MNNIVFDQSLMGFNRTQVLEYIDTLVKQLKDQEQEYTKKQQELSEEVSSLSSQCNEHKQELTYAAEKVEKLNRQIEEFKNDNFQLQAQVDKYKTLIGAKDTEIADLKKNAFSLKTRCELLTAENELWKKRQDKIGECLIEANMKAEEIINSAKQEAEQTKQSIINQTVNLSGNVINLKEEISRVERQLEQSFTELQSAIENLDSSADAIRRQVDSFKTKAEAVDTSGKLIEEKNIDTYRAVSAVKNVRKTLTDSVLDTITKILDK